MNESNANDRRYMIMSEIMTPNMINFSGHVHGGYILGFLDKVAYACSARYASKPTVTLSIDQVFFKEPVDVGELITCYSAVNYVGRTSMEIGIKVVAENLHTGKQRHTTSCYFTMVAIDKNGKPSPVPSLKLTTATEKRRFAKAELRKKMRLNYFDELKQLKSED